MRALDPPTLLFADSSLYSQADLSKLALLRSGDLPEDELVNQRCMAWGRRVRDGLALVGERGPVRQ